MIPEKVINFIGTEDYDKILEELANFLGFDWSDQKMPLLISWFNEVLRANKQGDDLKNFTKELLSFLDEEKLNQFLNYFEEKYRQKLDELWQEEFIEETKLTEEPEETFEEKEKRYLELMKQILKKQEEPTPFFFEEDQHPEPIVEKESEKITISFSPEETLKIPSTPKLDKQELELPENTVIVRKGEEKSKEKSEEEGNLLDLSHL